MNRKISRRSLLRGIGIAIGLPVLEAMVPATSVHANSRSADPIRLAFLFVPNGAHMPDWTPKQTGSSFELPSILQPIERHRQKINVLTGLTLNGARALGDGSGDHARAVASFLTGAHPKKTDGDGIRNGISVDQVAANSLGRRTKLRSLELGSEFGAQAGRCDSGYSCAYLSSISWRSETTPVVKEIDPAEVFDRLFGTGNLSRDRLTAAQRRATRKSILDYAADDVRRLSRRLGLADRQSMDDFLYSIRDVERRITDADKLDQAEDDVPDYPRPAGVPREYGEHMKLLFDVMALAFQTDSTRIISLMYANAQSNRSYRNIEIRGGHHDLSHHGNDSKKQSQISKINRYHMSLFDYFLSKMSAVREGNGTLLDNCMIVYGSGIADGNEHAHHRLPILLAGSGGGAYETGRHLEFPHNTPLTNLYLSMLNISGARTKSFSDSSGLLPGIGA